MFAGALAKIRPALIVTLPMVLVPGDEMTRSLPPFFTSPPPPVIDPVRVIAPLASKTPPPVPREIGRASDAFPEIDCSVAPFVNVIVPVAPAKMLVVPIATVPPLKDELPVAVPVPASVSFPAPSLMIPPVPIAIVLLTVMSPAPPKLRLTFVPPIVPESVRRSASESISVLPASVIAPA